MNSQIKTFKSIRTLGLKSFFTVLLLTALSSQAATVYTSKANGNWSSSSTWTISGSGSPVTYIIKAGHTVTANTSAISIDSIKVMGTLNMANAVVLTLNNSGRIDVNKNGIITGGNAATYFWFALASLSSDIAGPFNGSSTVNGPVYATKNTNGFIATPAALPVELLFFNAVPENRVVNLSWETASEFNNDHFDVQRSTDGQNWISIGTVQGQGSSSDISSYSFTDETPMFGSNIYRLVQVDYNGQSSTSPEVKLTLTKSSNRSDINAYPNPANNELNITIENRDLMKNIHSAVTVVNNMGQTFNVGITENLGLIQIDTQSLPEGLYSISIMNAGETYSKNIIVKH